MNVNEFIETVQKVDRDLWEKVLINSMLTIVPRVITEIQLIQLAKDSSSPEELMAISIALYKYSKSNPNPEVVFPKFITMVDESKYTLKNWITAFFSFSQWMKKEDRDSDILTMLGYIQCCTISGEQNGLELTELLEEMLEEYGFNGGVYSAGQ